MSDITAVVWGDISEVWFVFQQQPLAEPVFPQAGHEHRPPTTGADDRTKRYACSTQVCRTHFCIKQAEHRNSTRVASGGYIFFFSRNSGNHISPKIRKRKGRESKHVWYFYVPQALHEMKRDAPAIQLSDRPTLRKQNTGGVLLTTKPRIRTPKQRTSTSLQNPVHTRAPLPTCRRGTTYEAHVHNDVNLVATMNEEPALTREGFRRRGWPRLLS